MEDKLAEVRSDESGKSELSSSQQPSLPSPLQGAIPLTTDRCKQRYKNDDYLNEVLVLCEDNPDDDDRACFYVAASFLMFRMVNAESIKFLRKKFAYLLNYQRLITAREPELTMERLATFGFDQVSQETFQKWESIALNGGARRIFIYFLSYIINHPIYVLDLSTNEWREYLLSATNHEQSQFHRDFVGEFPHFNFVGPPFMLAEHLELNSNGKACRTHVSAMVHKLFSHGNVPLRDTILLRFKDYISVRNFLKIFSIGKLMKRPVVRSMYSYVFAECIPEPDTATGEDENVPKSNE